MISPEEARERFRRGAIVVMEGVPRGTEVGVDFHGWAVGQEFRGLKMIPAPQLHLFHITTPGYSWRTWNHVIPVMELNRSQQRAACFRWLKPGEIWVTRWDPVAEQMDWNVADEELEERYRSRIQDLDRHLGPYPIDEGKHGSTSRWTRLTRYITPQLLGRILPTLQVTSMTSSTIQDHVAGMPDIQDPLEIQFTEISLRRSFDPNAIGEERTRYSLDKSWLLRKLLGNLSHDRPEHQQQHSLLGELQLAFILLLVGQNFEGLEQWKRILHLVCFSNEWISQHPARLEPWLLVLAEQLSEIPADFFHDVISNDNFLRPCLLNVYRVLSGEGGQGGGVRIGEPLWKLLETRFQWNLQVDFEQQENSEEEDEEDGPTIVPLEELELT